MSRGEQNRPFAVGYSQVVRQKFNTPARGSASETRYRDHPRVMYNAYGETPTTCQQASQNCPSCPVLAEPKTLFLFGRSPPGAVFFFKVRSATAQTRMRIGRPKYLIVDYRVACMLFTLSFCKSLQSSVVVGVPIFWTPLVLHMQCISPAASGFALRVRKLISAYHDILSICFIGLTYRGVE